jgi:hypothetical protein
MIYTVVSSAATRAAHDASQRELLYDPGYEAGQPRHTGAGLLLLWAARDSNPEPKD